MNTLTYTEIIQSYPVYTESFSNENIQKLLNKMGNFQNQLQVIHIGGTNGKGSTCRMLTRILKEEKYKVGTFMSPHILDYCEGILLEDMEIAKEKLQAYVEEVNVLVEKERKKGEEITRFEFYTVVALYIFYKEKVDYAIIEVGMGGRDDATNVFSHPLVTAFTSISLDHIQILGSSVEEIAKVKSGIIKKSGKVVIGKNQEKVKSILKKKATEVGAVVIEEQMEAELKTIDQVEFLQETIQQENAKVVLGIIKALDIAYRKSNMIKALEGFQMPCRQEHIERNGNLFIIDGGHNEKAMEALKKHVKRVNKEERKKIITLFGVLEDKEVEKLHEYVYEFSDEIIYTKPLSDRAYMYTEDEVLHKAKNAFIEKKVEVLHDIEKAVQKLYRKKENAIYVVCGSFYIAYPARKILLSQKS